MPARQRAPSSAHTPGGRQQQQVAQRPPRVRRLVAAVRHCEVHLAAAAAACLLLQAVPLRQRGGAHLSLLPNRDQPRRRGPRGRDVGAARLRHCGGCCLAQRRRQAGGRGCQREGCRRLQRREGKPVPAGSKARWQGSATELAGRRAAGAAAFPCSSAAAAAAAAAGRGLAQQAAGILWIMCSQVHPARCRYSACACTTQPLTGT